jgi:hypothetical protein
MSLTRTLQWQKEEKSSLVHAQDLSKIEQTGLSKQAKGVLLAPSADKLKAIVWIDGEEVPVLMKQEIKEYFDATEYGGVVSVFVSDGLFNVIKRGALPKDGTTVNGLSVIICYLSAYGY